MNPNMSPLDWAKRPIQKYADFSGRAPRAEYWWFYLAYVIAYVVAVIIDSIVGFPILRLLVVLAVIVPMLAVGARRLHDTNRSGWWQLAPAVPGILAGFLMGPALLNPAALFSVGILAGILMLVALVLGIMLLVFLVLPSQPGENRFGPNPYGEDLEQVFA